VPQPLASAHTTRGEKWEGRERIEGEGGRRKGQGYKCYFTIVLSPPKPEVNILMDTMYSHKFVTN